MSEPAVDDWQRHLANWGRQTIAFAMSQHAMDVGKSLDDPDNVRSAGVEAGEITQRLWSQATEKHKDVAGFQAVFIRSVFDWCYDHLAYDEKA